jgi:hypothetical protein
LQPWPQGGDSTSGRDNDGDLPAHQILGKGGQFVVLARCPRKFEAEIAPFDIARLFEAIAECRQDGRERLGGLAAEIAYHRHRLLLRSEGASRRHRSAQQEH